MRQGRVRIPCVEAPFDDGFTCAPRRVRASIQRVSPRDHGPAPILDEVSKRIIDQLQEDGRRPYAAIGKAVGLSEAAVRQRVQRLLDGT